MYFNSYFIRNWPNFNSSSHLSNTAFLEMTQTEKNAFGALLNFSYDGESRVILGNGGGIQLFGDILTCFKQMVSMNFFLEHFAFCMHIGGNGKLA